MNGSYILDVLHFTRIKCWTLHRAIHSKLCVEFQPQSQLVFSRPWLVVVVNIDLGKNEANGEEKQKDPQTIANVAQSFEAVRHCHDDDRESSSQQDGGQYNNRPPPVPFYPCLLLI